MGLDDKTVRVLATDGYVTSPRPGSPRHGLCIIRSDHVRPFLELNIYGTGTLAVRSRHSPKPTLKPDTYLELVTVICVRGLGCRYITAPTSISAFINSNSNRSRAFVEGDMWLCLYDIESVNFARKEADEG